LSHRVGKICQSLPFNPFASTLKFRYTVVKTQLLQIFFEHGKRSEEEITQLVKINIFAIKRKIKM